jgi:hypothetical protein
LESSNRFQLAIHVAFVLYLNFDLGLDIWSKLRQARHQQAQLVERDFGPA